MEKVETINIGPKTEEELISVMTHITMGCLDAPLSIKVTEVVEDGVKTYSIDMLSRGVVVDGAKKYTAIQAAYFMMGVCAGANCYRRQFSLVARKKYRDW